MQYLLSTVFLLFLAVASLSAQADWLTHTVSRDTSVRRGQLANGLTYYIRANNEPRDRAEFRLVVKAGSLHEDDDQLGVAHFVEHMAFNGTRHFAANDLVHFLEKTGARFGPDLNAYTAFDRTVYQLQLATDSSELLDQGLTILRDWASEITFDSLQIEKERGVVIAEWRSRLSAPQRMQQVYLPKLLQGSRYAQRLPIGSPALIDTVDRATLLRYYQREYRPEKMAVVAVGNFSVDWMEHRIRQQFGDLTDRSSADATVPADSIPLLQRREVVTVTDPEVFYSQLQYIIKHADLPVDSSWAGLRRALVQTLYNRLLNERFYPIIQQPDPPFTFASSTWSSLPGNRRSYAVSISGAAEKLAAGFTRILLENRRLKEHGFLTTELERAKQKLLQEVEHAYRERNKRSSAQLANQQVADFLQPVPTPSLAQYYERLDALLATIGVADLNGLAQRWADSEDHFLLLSAPTRESILLPPEKQLWQLTDSVADMSTQPYIDEVPLGTLGEGLNLPAVSITQLPGDTLLGIQHYRLANGIELWLKPTDFTDDRFRFTAFSPGGSSLLADSLVPQVQHLFSVMELSGLSDFSATQLEKLLAGKQVSVSPYIQDSFEGFSGSAAPDDLETLFRVLYLQATDSRFDSTVFAAYLSRNRDILSNTAELPDFRYARFRNRLLWQDHPRMRYDPLETLERLDLAQMQAIFADRFADFSDYRFVFVGRFSPDSLLNAASRYLGNLPTSGRQENWRDTGIRYLAQATDTTFVGSGTPKARIEMILHDTIAYTAHHRYLFSSLRQLLNIRLREELREEQGEIYGIQVGGTIAPYPEPRFRLSIRFQCDPVAADTLIHSIWQEVDRLASGDITSDVISKIQASQLKSYAEAQRSDGFWLGQLSTRLRYGIPFASLYGSAYAERVGQLSAIDLAKATQRFVQQATPLVFRYLPAE